MGDTTYQIEQELHTTRNKLSDNLGELQDRIKDTFDWRTQFSERPGTMLAIAFGGGLLLSAILPRQSRSRGLQNRFESTNSNAGSAAPNETAKTINALKNAVVGTAIAKATAFVEELLPGFKEEFAKAKVGT
jgi:hypothetical protein